MMLTLGFLALLVKLVAADNLIFPELDIHNCMGNPFELNFFEKRAKDPSCATWYQKLQDAKDIDSCPSLEREEICVEKKLYAFVAGREERCQQGDFEKAEKLCIKITECWAIIGDDTCVVNSDNPCTESLDSMRLTICQMLQEALMSEDDAAIIALSPMQRSDAANMDEIYDKAYGTDQEPNSGDAKSDKDSSSESDDDSEDTKNGNNDTDTDKDDTKKDDSGDADTDSNDSDTASGNDDDDDVAPAPSKEVSVVKHAVEGPQGSIEPPVDSPPEDSAEPPTEPPVEGPTEEAYAPGPYYAPSEFQFPDELFDPENITEYTEEEKEYEAAENAQLEAEYGDDQDIGVGFGSEDDEGSNGTDEVSEDNAFVKIENKVENGDDEEEVVADSDKPPVVERQIEMTGDETSDQKPSRLIPMIVIAALLVAGGGVLYAFIRARRARQYEKYTENVEPAPYGGYTGGYDRSHDTEMATQPPAASDQRLSQILLSATEGQNGNGKNGSDGARV